jgi:hypothetical protein
VYNITVFPCFGCEALNTELLQMACAGHVVSCSSPSAGCCMGFKAIVTMPVTVPVTVPDGGFRVMHVCEAECTDSFL